MVQRGLRKPEARPVGQTNNSLTLIARQEAGGAIAFQLCLLRNFEWPGRLGSGRGLSRAHSLTLFVFLYRGRRPSASCSPCTIMAGGAGGKRVLIAAGAHQSATSAPSLRLQAAKAASIAARALSHSPSARCRAVGRGGRPGQLYYTARPKNRRASYAAKASPVCMRCRRRPPPRLAPTWVWVVPPAGLPCRPAQHLPAGWRQAAGDQLGEAAVFELVCG